MRSATRVIGTTALVCILAFVAGQSQSIIDTPHNLSAGGPGAIRASSEQEVCIFCHAPHNASSVKPLWNRSTSAATYTVYRSNALEAEPGQPTGASKMCLSCHDGTIALGSVVSRGQTIQMASGITTLPPGHSNLGTDLSDDHPVSFRYDSSLASRKPGLLDPGSIPPVLRLDHNQELQCTTCHDPHNNMHGNFLVMSNANAAMCRSCHTLSNTDIPQHADCAGCHQPHTAPSGPYLLNTSTISSTCISCHDGSQPGVANIAAELNRISTHDTASPIEPPAPIHGHATCADCHNPHTMQSGGTSQAGGAPHIPPNFGVVRGVNASGTPISAASYEYEVCFRCHGDQNAISSPRIPRQIAQTNTRLQFSSNAISYHPVQVPGNNSNVPSLRSPWTTGSLMYCSDCHGSDTSQKAGGAGPDGLHGSNHAPLLLSRYETTDFTMESASTYALCYRCHEREGPGGILNNASFAYHRLHVVDQRTPCSVCHDAHGISSGSASTINHAHLMNFDISVVLPDPVTGRLEFRNEGTFTGSCYLSCHGVNHSPKTY